MGQIFLETFLLTLTSGYAVSNGSITGRVKDTMVTGNVYKALKEVIGLGNDCRWIESCYTPSLMVDGLSITG